MCVNNVPGVFSKPDVLQHPAPAAASVALRELRHRVHQRGVLGSSLEKVGGRTHDLLTTISFPITGITYYELFKAASSGCGYKLPPEHTLLVVHVVFQHPLPHHHTELNGKPR